MSVVFRLLILPLTLASLGFPSAAAREQDSASPEGFGKLVLKSGKTRLAEAVPGSKRAPGAATKAQVQTTKAGPWGEIEYFTTQIEVPESLLKLWEVPSLSLDWHFMGAQPAEVEQLFRSLDLPAEIRADLLTPARWRTESDSVVVSPSAQTIEGLPEAARNAIYAVLTRFPENPFQFEPTLVPGGDVAEWLGADALRPEILAMMQKTLHHRGKTAIFSDKGLILRLARGDDERLLIRKVLSRTPTLICKLILKPDSDPAKLAEYWSAGRRTEEITPFLESMHGVAGVDRVDLVHLLPAAVRKLLYTFPNESHGLAGYFPDCHWTSLNFFNYEPLQRLAEPPLATAYTIENYVEVPKPERLGDVLFLMDKQNGTAYHSCVYIADDIVFTKNGRSRLTPWVLMKLAAVRELYGIYQETSVVTYRLKTRK